MKFMLLKRFLTTWPVLLALLLLLPAAAPAAPTKPEAAPKSPTAREVEKRAEQAVVIRRQAQERQDAWAPRRAEMLTKLEDLTRQLEVTQRLRKKTEIYLAGQKAKLAETQRRLAEMDRIQAELEPLLDETLVRLRAFVDQDLPFKRDERLAALEAVEQTLNDYDAGLAQKTRRLLGGILTEARYGHDVRLEPGEIKTQGGALQVDLLRLGRLALFGLSLDRQRAWRLMPGETDFKPVEDHLRGLDQAAQMAARRRVVELVELPVGGAPSGTGGAQ